MHNRIEMTGKKIRGWTVIEEAGRDGANGIRWKCLCKCGKTKVVRGNHLRGERVRPCGCHEEVLSRKA